VIAEIPAKKRGYPMKTALKSTLFTLLGLAVTALPCAYGTDEASSPKDSTRLENGQCLVEVSPANGAITRILDKPSRIELAPPPELADNFRLLLLRPDNGTLTILGKDQKLSSVSRAADGLVLKWDGPLNDTTGTTHKIAVRMDVKAAGNELQFSLHLDNGSGCRVQEARYPLLGGLYRFGLPGKPGDGVVWIPTSVPATKPINRPFGCMDCAYPGEANMSFSCVQSTAAKKSLYFASHDEIARRKVYRFEECGTGGVKDVVASIIHSPFTPPGKAFDGSTVVVRVVDGDWRAAGRVYRAWFEKTFGLCKPADCWIRRQSFFQFTMFKLPEGTINLTFKDIPQWAKDAKDHGINAVQISGWQVGGHDNGYPCYTPDPSLGTWQDLEDGIKACHKLGLKVYFFVNYQQVMLDMEWYKKELVKYREWGDPKGSTTWNAGWPMGTLWGRIGHQKLMTGADPAFPEYRKIIVDYFAKLAEIGADGVHVDKMFPAALDYNPNLPMSPDTGPWEGAILLTKEVMAACRKHNPDWAMSFECNWDRMLQFTGATWWVGNQLITRKVFPENAEMLLIASAYDYLGVNNAVREGNVVMLGPMNMCRSVGWKPFEGLADYIKEVKRIQDSLTDTVFLGELLGHEGVTMPNPGVAYNVFRNLVTGKHVCILTNAEMQPKKQQIAGFAASRSSDARVHTPFQAAKVVKLPAEIEVPAEGIVFFEELTSRPEATDGAVDLPSRASNAAEENANTTQPLSTQIANGGFESGDFSGWIADPNWVIARDSRGYYSGWRGKCWAWSGGQGERATGKLKSKPFVLDKNGVRFSIAGWNSLQGSGKPRKWNYVTLNLADGVELDRVYAPNSTAFVPAVLSGVGYRGKKVYIEAVDDADQEAYSMLCIDDVHTFSSPLMRPLPPLAAFNPRNSLQLEDDRYLVEVNRDNGAIERIRDKKGGLELIREPRLADNFRFTLPIPGKEPWDAIEANYVWGNRQKLSSFNAGDKKLTLEWNKPLVNYLGEKYDVSATMGIELIPEGILLTLAVDNATRFQIGEVFFPLIGGIQGLGKTGMQLKSTELVRPTSTDAAVSADIFRVFTNMSWLGDQGPEQFYAYPKDMRMPWMEFFAPKLNRSVYIGLHDKADRPTVLRLELIPSNSNTVREDGNWPRPNELKGLPVGVSMCLVDFANAPPRTTYRAPPVLISFHDGDWHEARKAASAEDRRNKHDLAETGRIR
jgi:hypothetical protein